MATYKSTMRSLQATARRIERESARRQRDLERRQREAAKLAAQDRAAYDVAVYDNYLEVMTSLHIDVGPRFEWAILAQTPPPAMPPPVQHRQAAARQALEGFEPGKLLRKRADRRRSMLESDLERAITADEEEFRAAIADHRRATERHAEQVELAGAVIAGDREAYVTVLSEMSELGELAELGERLEFGVVSTRCVTVSVDAHSDNVIPTEQKSLLASGKLSVKALPVSRRWGLYQDHVCSAALRAARDVFALLPVEMVIVTVQDQVLNSTTGHKELVPILSVAVARSTIDDLNLSEIDPSDAMQNFVHNMTFQKTKGFKPCDVIDPNQFA